MKNTIIITLSFLFCLNIMAAPENMSSFPIVEEVSFTNQGTVISGSLVLPNTTSLCPAIVIIDGSGKTQRKMEYAREIAKKGVAVLTYDKRGVGKSGGKYKGRRNASFENLNLLAGDAVAGIEILTTHEKIDKQRIGIWAGSQGGWIAPLAASISSNISFMVLLSSPSVPVSQEMRYSKLTNNDSEFLENHTPEQIESELRKKSIFQLFQSDFDPLPYLEKIDMPVLWIYGKKDRSIPVSTSINILNNLKKDNFQIKTYPDSGHSLRFPKGKWAPAQEINEFFINWIHTLK